MDARSAGPAGPERRVAARGRWLVLTGLMLLAAGGCGTASTSPGNGDGGGRDDRPARASGPNLTVRDVIVRTDRIDVGQVLEVAFEVENDGDADAGPVQAAVSLARSRDGNDTPIPLGTTEIAALDAGARRTSEPLRLAVPDHVRSGQYFVVVHVDPDDALREADEEDNVGATLLPLQVVNPLMPDLIVVAGEGGGPGVALSQTSVLRGSPVTALFTVKNVGLQPVGPSEVGVYLSDDAELSDEDRRLGTLALPELAGDEERELSLTFSVPEVPFGNYRVLVHVDDTNAIEEGDEGDNLGISEVLYVRPPPEHFTDLVASSVEVRNANPERTHPTTFFYGDPLEVTATFTNLGDLAASFFVTRVYLSRDRALDAPAAGEGDGGALADGGAAGGDLLVATINTEGLDGLASVEETRTRELGTDIPEGTYFVIVQVDAADTVYEADFEGNNLRVLDAPIVVSGDPPPPANDACEGAEPLVFGEGGQAVVTGSTRFALDQTGGSCGGGDGGDLYYTFTLERPGSLRAAVTGIDAAVYLRKDDCDGGEELRCARGRDLVLRELEPGTYFLVVDTADAKTPGGFTLTVTLGDPIPPAYTIDVIDPAYADISTTGTQVTIVGNTDAGCLEQRIGFDFPFFDQTYPSVRIHADGYLQLGDVTCTRNTANTPLPDPELPNNIIAAFWDDLGWNMNEVDPLRLERRIYVLREPERFVVQYTKWRFYSDYATDLSFQIILHASGDIELQYGTLVNDDLGRAQGDEATVGVENADATDGYLFSFNSPSLMAPMGLLFTRTR